MPVDVWVQVGLEATADLADAYDVRTKLARDVESARERGLGAALRTAREVGGGTQFEPLACDAQFEVVNMREAEVLTGVLVTSLLLQGFALRSPAGGLTQTQRAADAGAEPGVAVVQIIAPLGL